LEVFGRFWGVVVFEESPDFCSEDLSHFVRCCEEEFSAVVDPVDAAVGEFVVELVLRVTASLEKKRA
jgi:hypothetical protein